MGWKVTFIVISCYFLLSLFLLPFQYKYICLLKEMRKKSEEDTANMFEDMSFEKQELHLNAQGNPLFFGANLLAELVYYIKHRKRPR